MPNQDMGLKAILKQFKDQEQSFNNDSVNVFSKLKNRMLTVGKKNTSLTVRVLPPKDLENGNFYNQFRQISFLQSPKPGDQNTYTFNTAYPIDHEDPLEVAVAQWSKMNKIPNKYQQGLHGTYYIQVAKVIKDDAGKSKTELDDNGLPVVHVMQLNFGQLDKLMTALGVSENNPIQNDYIDAAFKKFNTNAEQQGDWSFISPAIAYPVTFSYDPDKPNNEKRDINVISSKILPPLPSNWSDALEDLDYLSQPSYKANPSLVQWFIRETDNNLGINPPAFKPDDGNSNDNKDKDISPDNSDDSDNSNGKPKDEFAGNQDDLLGGDKPSDDPFSDDNTDDGIDIDDDDLPF